MKPTFFPTRADFRNALAENHEKSQELWVGYNKKGNRQIEHYLASISRAGAPFRLA